MKKISVYTESWIKGAVRVVGPSNNDIYKSSRLALASEKLRDEEDAT